MEYYCEVKETKEVYRAYKEKITETLCRLNRSLTTKQAASILNDLEPFEILDLLTEICWIE